MKIKTIRLEWHSDPAHAWLRISRKDADFLGILPKITAFSYQSKAGNTLYLEEDCDAPLAIETLRARTDALPKWMMDKHTNKSSPVRRLHAYNFTETIEVYQPTDLYITRLDATEKLIRDRIRPDYTIPRPGNGYPWGLGTFADVMENAKDYMRERLPGYWVYFDTQKRLIVTNDRTRMIRDYAEIAGKLQFISIK